MTPVGEMEAHKGALWHLLALAGESGRYARAGLDVLGRCAVRRGNNRGLSSRWTRKWAELVCVWWVHYVTTHKSGMGGVCVGVFVWWRSVE